GADCLGLVRGVWREVIGPEPETPPAYAPDWAEASGAELLARAAGKHFLPQESKACRAGDLLLFRWRTNLPAKHLGIATGPQTMVHAHEGACVCEVALSRWWKRRLVAVFSFPSASDVSR
ncbi:MAG: C40 family peptidase, partial [Hyphomicrobiales bacterium]|nr:C40 family peptidase [Hyphomicrobiales bacterium]